MAKKKTSEYHKRTVVKAVSWRVIATLTTMMIAFFITGKLTIALEIGLFEVIAKMLFYYLHERAWAAISWGKGKHPLQHLPVSRDIEPEDMEKIKKQLKDLGYME
jgi:uncharacterized membrane protein